ncbi:metallopeptidase, putative [Plasmodium chabaudi adami]|uniref:Metallopeptidase, putative n=1 Tax=Plasmodium chabaudi adami TaxID=5826 RepID=A0A1C6YHZ9_PLACE|nr:metallopeptidase, putative [Plasmodium chabaudi adami]
MSVKNLDDIRYKIHRVQALNDNDEKAKAILNKAAEKVQPIMKKRRFLVELLSEFLPKNPNLLGLNIIGKSEIKIRLRKKPGGEIFHFNDIMGTLLHELVHLVHRRHDKKFYALLDKLVFEYNELYIYNNINNSYGDNKNKSLANNIDENSDSYKNNASSKNNLIILIDDDFKIDNRKKSSLCYSQPKHMAAQAAERRLINNFINNDGEIINISLESCLTEKQRENLIKRKKEYDDKTCLVNNDVIIIDSMSSIPKNNKRKKLTELENSNYKKNNGDNNFCNNNDCLEIISSNQPTTKSKKTLKSCSKNLDITTPECISIISDNITHIKTQKNIVEYILDDNTNTDANSSSRQ